MEILHDLSIIALLVFLEGILSIDNALVLAMLARPLKKEDQKRALTYGLVGAMVFRLIAVVLAAYLIEWVWFKYIGGGYLILLAVKHLFFSHPQGGENDIDNKTGGRGFWKTVLIIELTDIVFAIDSILAAVALTNKIWIIFTGGVIGMILMRFAASMFIHMLERFPNLEKTAYILVLLIGLKVVIETIHIPGLDFHDKTSPAFIGFWVLMVSCLAYGFMGSKKTKPN
jgi:YkoY family integral membrane protein